MRIFLVVLALVFAGSAFGQQAQALQKPTVITIQQLKSMCEKTKENYAFLKDQNVQISAQNNLAFTALKNLLDENVNLYEREDSLISIVQQRDKEIAELKKGKDKK